MVILPPVVKVLLDPLLHFDIDILALVELFDESEKFGQIISVVESSIYGICLIEDLNEVSHDIGKDGNSE
jgi:hypothetical protein